jgi:ParB family chromosome partitioning protein
MSTLGKGLESLIPPNRRSAADASQAPQDAGATPTADAANVPVEPALGPERELMPPEPHEELLAHDSLMERPADEPAPPAGASAEAVIDPQPTVVLEEPVPPSIAATSPAVHTAVDYRQVKMPDAVFHIETEKIVPNPDQPRRAFDEAGIKELAASIREFGILQPLVVSKTEREVPTGTEVEYVLISGERRLLAAKMLGVPRVPVVIRNVSYDRERLELAVIENIQREDLNPIELARAYARLQDEFRMTQREIASRLGKSRETVANTVRLLDLAPKIQDALIEGVISESHGRLLLTVTDPGMQDRLFHDLVENRLTTRELKHRVTRAVPRDATKGGRPSGLPPELKMLEERLSAELGTPVSIHQHGTSGRITISYYSPEELQNILARLGGGDEG